MEGEKQNSGQCPKKWRISFKNVTFMRTNVQNCFVMTTVSCVALIVLFSITDNVLK
ncbi:hypothetical protein DPMN_061095 [Dreissena polymorpha]|uniref:Uncharacterized protein n=1 Tax=Dreissena polymorpha TaxID=45954 RepID=A0A9D4HGT1_DREPO|nr:hypothetical protein DPMN_061095 [Dreissena polymorpha]